MSSWLYINFTHSLYVDGNNSSASAYLKKTPWGLWQEFCLLTIVLQRYRCHVFLATTTGDPRIPASENWIWKWKAWKGAQRARKSATGHVCQGTTEPSGHNQESWQQGIQFLWNISLPNETGVDWWTTKLKCKIFSLKFCSLREEWKHEEMIVTTEKENCSLRQVNLVQAEHAFREKSSDICFTVLALGLEEWICPMKKTHAVKLFWKSDFLRLFYHSIFS